MLYCTNCGNAVEPQAAFCRQCGAKQPGPAQPGPAQPGAAHTGAGAASAGTTPQPHDFLAGIDERTACMLCYIPIFGIIPDVIFLSAQRFRRNVRVRFDAFQGLYIFVLWLIVSSAVPGFFGDRMTEHSITGLLRLCLIICWIYLLVKASQSQQVRLPVLGDLAARSAFEQL